MIIKINILNKAPTDGAAKLCILLDKFITVITVLDFKFRHPILRFGPPYFALENSHKTPYIFGLFVKYPVDLSPYMDVLVSTGARGANCPATAYCCSYYTVGYIVLHIHNAASLHTLFSS